MGGSASVSVEAAGSLTDSRKSIFVCREIAKSDRPQRLSAARIIFLGGRALGSSKNSGKCSPTGLQAGRRPCRQP